MSFIIGLDLGQSQDYTAVAIVERVRVRAPPAPVPEGSWASDTRPSKGVTPEVVHYHLRHLERPPLGTKYPTIVARVKTLLATSPLTLDTPLVIDRTGVGRPVTDMFEGEGVRPYAITITGGDEVIREGRHTKVPKRELVGTLVAVFQTGRLKIAAGLVEGPTLVNELTNFKVKVNLATGHDSYEAWRESVHDDLVLAVAMAVWHGEHTGGQVRSENIPFAEPTEGPARGWHRVS